MIYCGAHSSAKRITETAKSLKICYTFNTNRIYFKVVCRRTEMHNVYINSLSGSRVIEYSKNKSGTFLLRHCVDINASYLLRPCLCGGTSLYRHRDTPSRQPANWRPQP